MMASRGSDHCLITSSFPLPHHAQIGRLSRSGSALTASINSTGTSIDVPDPRQFAQYATKSVDGKPRRHPPRVLLLRIGMLAPGNPSLGRTLVAACHCAQRTKETPRFLWRRLAVGRSYAIKGGQEGFFVSCAELRNA
jgi:hypothetical protein